ncbi:hypothetical protein ACEO1E_004201 [Salmonella enterica]
MREKIKTPVVIINKRETSDSYVVSVTDGSNNFHDGVLLVGVKPVEKNDRFAVFSMAGCPNCSHEEPSETDDIVALYRSMETTATDAFLAEVRAQGADELAELYFTLAAHEANRYIADSWRESARFAKDYAAQLRKGGAA